MGGAEEKGALYLPHSVLGEVTGSVAMKTAPKQKPPKRMCSYQGKFITSFAPIELNIKAVRIPPAKTDNIVFQLAMPVHKRMMAPMPMAITLVSPIEPG